MAVIGRRAAAAVGLVLALLAAGCASGGPDVRAVGHRADPGAMSAPAASPTTPTTVAVGVDRVLTLGDSSMVDASGPIAAVFRAGGAAATENAAQSGFGLTGMMVDHRASPWESDWPALVETFDPQLSIVMLGGWDLSWIEQHGVEAYAQVVLHAVDVLSARGGKVLWLPMLPGGNSAEVTAIDDVLTMVAGARPGTLWTLDIDPSLEGPVGGYPRDYVDDEGRPVKLRKLDDWHLCQDGAARLAAMVHEDAVALGLSGPARTGWEDEPWRDDVAFDSPACWPRSTTEAPTPVP